MSMGNYFRGAHELQTVMATRQPTGIDHLTVVPTNFEPDTEDPADEDETAQKQ